jgi:putative heme-binding domain-containing protein
LIFEVGVLSFSAHAVEPWSDNRLGITNGLELWFDASRQSAGRSSLQLPSLTAGNAVDYLLDASGRRRHLAQPAPEQRPRFRQEFTGAFLRFDGTNDCLEAALLNVGWTNVTVFLAAAPRSNPGGFRAFFGFSQAGRNDYTSGFNLDFGPFGTPQLSILNAEGGGFGGVASLWTGPPALFGKWHSLTLVNQPGPQQVRLHFDGATFGARDRQPGLLKCDTFVLGARHYSNSGEPPFTQGFLHGDLAEFLLYGRALDESERTAVEKYLSTKYAALLALPPASGQDGSRPLVTVTNPPPVQMLVPGFSVRELPVALNNINNVKYRPDGKLVALGYDGKVHLLTDTNGDGLEDKAEPFWDKETIRAPIGLALTPPGYARGRGVFTAGKGKVVLIVDTNADDRADQEIPVATWQEPSEQHGVDGLGVAVDKNGSVYFSLGAASFTGAYLIDKTTGQSRYSLTSERGTILKVSPDFSKREIVCTGIRFAVALAFNREGDLFCTDQEGATWLPNGNPLDELLHIQPGRHYGFPPRHPKHLPNVIDEPSVLDYTPQHQSTCGLNFNNVGQASRLPIAGVSPAITSSSAGAGEAPALPFGPSHWAGDALVCGYSRGKLWRTKLVKTAAGYVARNQLLACLNALTVDACVSPRGDLVVATHSGQPDWGSGPNGKGKLWQVRYSDTNTPQPVLAWNASPTELRIAFDRPLTPAGLRDLTRKTRIESGRFVSAGDRFETLRPGYQVVYDQLSAPRFDQEILSTRLSPDRRTLTLVTKPRTEAVNYAVTLPIVGQASSLPPGLPAPDPITGKMPAQAGSKPAPLPRPGTESRHDEIDLLTDLTGVEAQWTAAEGKETWSGWLPHPDLEVVRELTRGSADHDRLWARLEQPGTLVLRGQLDLWQMLHPAIQPGSALDYERPRETVKVVFSGHFRTEAQFRSARFTPGSTNDVTFTHTGSETNWLPFSLTATVGQASRLSGAGGTPALLLPRLNVTWSTDLDPRPRALPLRRVMLPWASPKLQQTTSPAERSIPEITSGHWLRGKRLFFGDQLACGKCHRVRGEGNDVGPDLSNLIHRDYASVLKDIHEPNAAINPDHVAYNVELIDGEPLTAVLKTEATDQFTFADASGRTIPVAKKQVRSIKPATLSLMPEGLWTALSVEQQKDLMTFLLTTPLDPAPIEAANPPPPRKRADLPNLVAADVRRLTSNPELGTRNSKQSQSLLTSAPAKFNVVLCAGPKDHGPGEHDYPLWQKRWAKLLALAEGVTVGTTMNWPTAEQFKTADVIAFYSNNPGWNAERAKELDAFLARGGGLVYLHYAVDGHKEVDALAQRIGLAWRGGASRFRHGPLDLKLHPHPLLAGFTKLDFIDESYWQLVGDPKNIDLLASGIEDGAAQPLIWTRTQGKGRVFVSILGHYNWTFDDPLFRLLILRGLCWAGGQPMDRLAELATIGARMGD